MFHTHVPPDRLKLFIDDRLVLDPRPATPRHVFDSEPMALSGCHKLRATYSARDRDTSFEARWAKVGSAVQRGWARDALACDPACPADARCVAAARFGVRRKGARICLPRGRPSRLGEACSATQPCASNGELLCCTDERDCGRVSGVCYYFDR